MDIRTQSRRDSKAVYRLTDAAFGQNAEAELILVLQKSGDAEIDLVMEEAGAIIGHILFSRLQAPENCLALAPVSVHPSHQKRGVGSALIRAGIDRARRGGWNAIFLLGEPDYYSRFGFSVHAAAKYETPYPKAYFMPLELKPGFLEGQDGAVIYSEPFLALG